MQLMAKSAQDAGLSVNGTVKELMGLMQNGQVMADKVLPHFAKRLREFASGGLEKALQSNRVAMNRLVTTFQIAGNQIFMSGLSEGLTEFFNTSADSVKEMQALFKSMGAILGSVFKGLSLIIRKVTPVFVAIGEVLQDITGFTKEWSAALLVLVSPTVLGALISPAIRTGLMVIASTFTRILAPVVAVTQAVKTAAFWMEELLNIFTQRKIGLLFDPRVDKGALDGVMNLANMLTGGGRGRDLKGNNTGYNKTGMDSVVDTILPDYVKKLLPERVADKDPSGVDRLINFAADRNPLANIVAPLYKKAYGAVGDLGASVFQSAPSFWGDAPTLGNSSGMSSAREYTDRTPIQVTLNGEAVSQFVVESSNFRRGVKLVNSETN